jgi:SAM-dependent methyltransferase
MSARGSAAPEPPSARAALGRRLGHPARTLLASPLGRPAIRAHHRLSALRAAYRDRGAGATEDGVPIPPARLRVLVSGAHDAGDFLRAGRLHADFLQRLVEPHAAFGEMGALLDFGCGCGRIVRHWKDLGPALHGSDVNPALAGWCADNLPFVRAQVNGAQPPLSYAAGSFDLVLARSVFTHLPEPAQQAWLDELRRILKPGGHLLFSVHGEHFARDLHADEYARFARGEMVTIRPQLEGSNFCGTFQPPTYVRDRMLRGFELLTHFDPNVDSATRDRYEMTQDVYLVRVAR